MPSAVALVLRRQHRDRSSRQIMGHQLQFIGLHMETAIIVPVNSSLIFRLRLSVLASLYHHSFISSVVFLHQDTPSAHLAGFGTYQGLIGRSFPILLVDTPWLIGLQFIVCIHVQGVVNDSKFSLNRWIQTALSNSRNAVSSSSARTIKCLPSPRCASAIQIVRSSQSKPETQPQLHPPLLRLSAMISQRVTVP